MKRIILLDPSVGTTNAGDGILMRCARQELESLFPTDSFFITLPTHVNAFHWYDRIRPVPVLIDEIRKADHIFVCGTNLLTGSLLHRSSQWSLNRQTADLLRGSVLMGVGGEVCGASARGFAVRYTKKIYRTVLSDRYVHSVRTASTKQSIDALGGMQALNTGCFSQWMLTPEFCAQIHTDKADTVVFTLTDYAQDPRRDRKLIEILRRNYRNVVFYPQGLYDTAYLLRICDAQGIHILPSTVEAYASFLRQNPVLDYVGTRFHGGIFAMRHKARCILLSVDSRMNDMKQSVSGNILARDAVEEQLEDKLRQPVRTAVDLDFDAIRQWKEQFK